MLRASARALLRPAQPVRFWLSSESKVWCATAFANQQTQRSAASGFLALGRDAIKLALYGDCNSDPLMI